MPRPKNKIDLMELSELKFSELINTLENMSTYELNTSFMFPEAFLEKQKSNHWKRDKNVRDVIVHLYEWHQLLIRWVNNQQLGINKAFLPEPYNWRNYSGLNEKFWENHQQTTLNESIHSFKESHSQVMGLVEPFSDEELFTKGYLTWTGNSTLASYWISATSSHYDWAIKKIKRHKRELNSPKTKN